MIAPLPKSAELSKALVQTREGERLLVYRAVDDAVNPTGHSALLADFEFSALQCSDLIGHTLGKRMTTIKTFRHVWGARFPNKSFGLNPCGKYPKQSVARFDRTTIRSCLQDHRGCVAFVGDRAF